MINISKSPTEKAKDLVLLAFDTRSSKRKVALRAFKNILSLAEQRGYKDSSSMISHLQSVSSSVSGSGLRPSDGNVMVDKLDKLDKLTDKYINDLYEFVSSDEILQLSQVSSFN